MPFFYREFNPARIGVRCILILGSLVSAPEAQIPEPAPGAGLGCNLSFESHVYDIFQAPQQLGGHDNAPCVKACSCLDFALLVETDGRVNEFCSLFLEMSKGDRDVADKGFILCFAFWQYASRTFRGRASCFCGRSFQLAPLTCALVLRAEASLICRHLWAALLPG